MRNIKNPYQAELISRVDYLISPEAAKILQDYWHGIFRTTILELLPVEKISKYYSPDMGRPTKELYSMLGLIFIKYFMGWTDEETALQYMTNFAIQYALNVECDRVSLSSRTLQRYIQYVRKEKVAEESMIKITAMLLDKLNIRIQEQRLDSTHVFSNMAVFSRRQLCFKINQRFLIQVKRHNPEKYNNISKDITELYEKNEGWIFAETSPMKLQKNGKVYTPVEHLGYDMQRLIERFCNDEEFNTKPTYKDLVRVFSEQFVINDGKTEQVKNTGGKILLNPSDRDAEVGHKGVGYQVQISETCSKENPVQFVVTAFAEGASALDQNSFSIVVEQLKEEGHVPEVIYADKGYGSDKNYVIAQNNDIYLHAPTLAGTTGKKGLEDCKFDENNVMTECPAGNHPMKNKTTKTSHVALFHVNVCNKCKFKDICTSQKYGKNNRQFIYNESKLRAYKRKKIEATDQFKEKYKTRNGIEGLNGRLKQFTPLKRLKIRGRQAVHESIYSILAMHNVMQAARYAKKMQKLG
jgi:hypothetical protein